MTMKLIIDRIEEDKVVAETENGDTILIPKVLIDGFKEGDHIILSVRKDENEEVDTHSIFERLRKKSKSDT
ncbi:MAG: DUF3006 family protein [Ruminococcus sp.]|nr:DUF3006 family protein [Ruminococcus sp.]